MAFSELGVTYIAEDDKYTKDSDGNITGEPQDGVSVAVFYGDPKLKKV